MDENVEDKKRLPTPNSWRDPIISLVMLEETEDFRWKLVHSNPSTGGTMLPIYTTKDFQNCILAGVKNCRDMLYISCT